jgi:hypothetical protein
VGVGCGYAGEVVAVWLFQQRFLPLFPLTEDLNIVLELREPCSLPVYVLPFAFGSLSCGLSMCDGFLLLMKPFYLLLNPGELYFYYDFIIENFMFPVFHLDLLKLYVFLNDLKWQRFSWR